MSQTTIPKEAELRNWAARELSAKGSVGLDKMPRLKSVTQGAHSEASANLSCRRDEAAQILGGYLNGHDGGNAVPALSEAL